jgi:hypothetical protein
MTAQTDTGYQSSDLSASIILALNIANPAMFETVSALWVVLVELAASAVSAVPLYHDVSKLAVFLLYVGSKVTLARIAIAIIK